MKRFIQIAALLCTLVVGAAALALIVSQTAWFKDWLRGFIVRQADGYVNGRLTIDRLGGNLFFGVELENVRLTMGGEPVVAIEDVGVDYSIFNFISRGIVLDDIRLNRPVVHLERTGDGWNLGRVLKEQEREAEREGPARPVSIGEIGISDGTLVVSGPVGTSGVDVPQRIEGLNASIGFAYEPVRYSVDIGHISFTAEGPAFELHELSGRVAVRGDTLYVDDLAIRTKESSLRVDGAVEGYTTTPVLKLTASSDKLALAEFARLFPALEGYTLQPAFEVRASGPLERLQVSFDTRSSAGQAAGEVVADLDGPERAVAGEISLERLDLAPLLRNAEQRSDITGRATFDLTLTEARPREPLSGINGTWRVTAPRVAILGYAASNVAAKGRFDDGTVQVDGRANAYGGAATVRGSIDPGTPLALDLRGRATGLDLRNLPKALNVPGMPGDIDATYHVRGILGQARNLTADVTFARSVLADATIAEGSTARVHLRGQEVSYAADATVADLDLQKIGQGLGVEGLASDRFQTNLNGRLTAAGSGTSLETLSLDAGGALHDSTLFGGRVPEISFEARVADSQANVKAAGRFAGFDPAVLAGRPELKGEVAGSLDVQATVRDLGGPMSPDGISAAGRVELATSQVGDVAIERAVVEGQYDDRHGRIDRLQISGPALEVQAAGALDLREGGRTDIQYNADLKRLEPLASAAGVELSGSMITEGRVTGNGTELGIDGNLSASNVQHPSASVLSAKTDYSVRLPHLSMTEARVTVDGTATLLEVAGRELTEAAVQATWQGETVAFNTTVSDQQRTVNAEGDVVLHPDHQEIHLRDFGIQTEGVAWRTAANTESAIRYGGGRVEIDQLRLVSDGQQISASGGFGATDDRLRIEATDVQLSTLDRLALGENRFAGTLNATATLAGTREAPRAEGKFTITDGSFRDFKYQSLNGTVDYTADGLTLDTRLTQTETSWITAAGFVPAAFFRGAPAPEGAGTAHEAHAEPGGSLDLRVTSSALDLGIVQGFVPQLSAVSGTLQADIRASGTPADPHAEGSIEIRNGAFTVADLTAAGYTGLDTRITFETDRVNIERLRILDEHRNWLEIEGQLALHERQVGQVRIAVRSDQFEVIDNELADVKINTDVTVSGDLQRPRVEGTIGIHAGTIELDRLLEQTTSDAYAVKPMAIESAPQAAISPAAGATAVAEAGASPVPPAETSQEPPVAEGGLFQALALDVSLSVPNNLVVKGEALNPSGASPIGLGDVNVTIGGDIRARKAAGNPDVVLVGTVNTVRGTYDFQGRRFEIQRDGRIQFVGTTPIDPRLDITARRVISGVEALVHVRGTARAPELRLSSNPPLDEADILSLIVFNQPANSLGEGQQASLAQRAGALATGFVASSLASSISGALELDVFEIQTSAEAGGGGTLTVGEQVGERLFVKFRQGFGAQAISEFILEYQLADFLRLQTSVAEGAAATQRTLTQQVEQSGVDLIFFFSY